MTFEPRATKLADDDPDSALERDGGYQPPGIFSYITKNLLCPSTLTLNENKIFRMDGALMDTEIDLAVQELL